MKILKAIFSFLGKVLKFFFIKKSCCEYSDTCRIKDENEEQKNG